MVNNVLSMKFNLFSVKNLTKPVTATRVVNRDKGVQPFVNDYLSDLLFG